MSKCEGEAEDPFCSCPGPITFCDSYRELMGMPGVLEPDKCYFWQYGGCRYLVAGSQMVACDPTPGPTHNVGTYGGYKDRAPEDNDCGAACLDGPDTYFVPCDSWVPACKCGDRKTITFDAGGNKCCGCDCDPDGPVYPCSKFLPSATLEFVLQSFPSGWTMQGTTCTAVPQDCVECKFIANNPPVGLVRFNALVGGNYCDDNCPHSDPCLTDPNPFCPGEGGYGISCGVSGTGIIYLDTMPFTPAVEATFELGFQITRSCDPLYDVNVSPWVQGGPYVGSPGLAVSDCFGEPGCEPCEFFARQVPGTSARKFASTINRLLSDGATDCVTYVAWGRQDAWIGGSAACILENPESDDPDPMVSCLPSQNACHSCVPEPHVWIGPFFTNGGRTASWYFRPQYWWRAQASYGGLNFSRYSSEYQRCRCTGSNSGGIGGDWITQWIDPPVAPAFKYGGDCPGLTPFVPMNPTCLPNPTIT